MDISREDLEALLALYRQLSPEKKKKYQPLLLQAIATIENRLSPEERVPPEQPPNPAVPVNDIARQLWTLARGDPDIFRLYVHSYPDTSINRLGQNEAAFNNLMGQINNTQSIPPRGNMDGVEQAPLQSSNVYGFRYDPLKRQLTVRFQEGSVYRYAGVPKAIFDMFAVGDGVAKTKGSNRWGRWWRGKTPSMGAALNSLIKIGGYPYQKIK